MRKTLSEREGGSHVSSFGYSQGAGAGDAPGRNCCFIPNRFLAKNPAGENDGIQPKRTDPKGGKNRRNAM